MIKAKYNTKQKQAIWDRDGWACVICWVNSPLEFHHCFFSTESMYTKDRNSLDYGVCVCAYHHRIAHSCSKWEWVRQQCIEYCQDKKV